MTRDVLIRISGLQALDGEKHDVEVIITGDYFFKNGKHYVIYDEMMEGLEGSVHNTVKITQDRMDIQKNGAIGAHMVFELDKKRQTRYATPLGDMVVDLTTTRIDLDEQEDNIRVSVDYSLGINYQHISDNSIIMDIWSRQKAQLKLRR
ncbi:DUF1934 domain-containing protein [Clostridiaceae bacterium]|nr:DUF1934 domain-containing protein [Clostridiaceae bacterium]RKI13412.1 DUF1934 domain-containing protein [bacterium 1XD21-70]